MSKTTPQFRTKLVQVAQRLGMDPNWLAAAMAFESGFNPQAVNGTSGATGLIQFMPSTAKTLGTTTSALYAMSAIEQLDWVEKYFNQFQKSRKWKGPQDVYFAIFLPSLIGKGLDDVAASAGSPIYDQNKVFDKSGKGYFTARDVASPILGILSAAEKKTGVTVSDVVAVAVVSNAVLFGVLVGGYLAWRKKQVAEGKKVPI